MRKQLLAFALGVIVMSGVGFTTYEYQVRKDTAEVNQVRGMCVFVDAKPVKDYETLGNVKTGGGFWGDTEYTEQRDRLVTKAKKEYPQADGILIQMSSGKKDQAEAIKFK